MEKTFLTRQYLETLSSADLMALAEDYDIDIPAELNRRFIIGELLEVAEELASPKDADMIISSEKVVANSNNLPESYNETYLNVVLRNPAWIFVFWDISAEDLAMLKRENVLNCQLHVSFFETEEEAKSNDFFDVQISLEDRVDVLASSKKIELAHGCKALFENTPGKTLDFSPVMKLSGIEELLRIHYARHRQSFEK